MNTKICTDIEQSKKLIELGLDINTADMYWSMDEIPFLSFPINNIDTDWEYAQENGMFPAWSLTALLELILKHKEVNIYLTFIYHNEEDKYMTSYLYFSEGTDKPIGNNSYDKNLFNAAFKTVCWLKENGKI